ncbi:MAG: hypothetical protein H8E44_18055 [Planctomycetes bacterium]|nr:hypothetical protein [Planctomycetota bacterium]MBL7043822.1 hypothetical protein [Pirellulaceae bacterium]
MPSPVHESRWHWTDLDVAILDGSAVILKADHPAWTLGHLAIASNSVGVLTGLESTLPDDWQAKFGRGSTPAAGASAYPKDKG